LPHEPAIYLLQALLSLALVVALIYAAYWLLRRSSMGGAARRANGPAELLQSLPLHGGYALHVVRLGGRLIGITCGPGGVTATEMDGEAAADADAPTTGPPPADAGEGEH